MIRQRVLYPVMAASLGLAAPGTVPGLASPGGVPNGQPATPANVIPFTCSVHLHLHTCGHLTVQPGEHVYIQLDSNSPLNTAVFCVPRSAKGFRCAQLYSADDSPTDFGPNTHTSQVRVAINVTAGPPDRATGTVTGTWWSQ